MTPTAFDILHKMIERYFRVRILWNHAYGMVRASTDFNTVRDWLNKADKYMDEIVSIELMFSCIGASCRELHDQWDRYESDPTDERITIACHVLMATIH